MQNFAESPHQESSGRTWKQSRAFRFLQLDCPLLLEEFRQTTFRRVGVLYPHEYLQRSSVIAIVQKSERKIVGGYIMAKSGPLRAIEQLPKEILEQNAYLRLRLHRCVEINGFWLDHHQSPQWTRLWIWADIFWRVVGSAFVGKYYFVYSFDASKQKLEKLYQVFRPTRLFHGEVKMLPGMKAPEVEIVEICSVMRVILSALTKPHFFLLRWRRPRRLRLAPVEESQVGAA